MADCAVLMHHYRVHLDNAIASGTPVTFFSNSALENVAAAMNDNPELPIYFVVTGGNNRVEYQGTITQLVLSPFPATAAVKEMLAHCPDAAAANAIEEGTAKTLYMVTDLKKVVTPFAQSDLLKVSDGTPVREKFARGSCLVEVHS